MSKFFDGELLSGYEESPKTTIFGEEHFIDTAMIKLVQQKNEAVDNYIFEQMANSIKGSVLVEMPQVIIDKEKLKKWVVLCMKLENIEHSELVDMATKKRIADLEAKLAESERESNARYESWQEEIRECDRLRVVLAEVREQLAEKEKEIEDFKKPQLVFKNKLDIEELKKQLDAEPFIVIGLDTSEVKMSLPNQDKIELLEKVKKLLEKEYRYDVEESDFAVVYEDDVDKIFDNQIKQLKEGK